VLGATHWRDYLALTKPRVVALIVLTAVVGTFAGNPWPAAPRCAAVRKPRHRAGGPLRPRPSPPCSTGASSAHVAHPRPPAPTGALSHQQACCSRAFSASLDADPGPARHPPHGAVTFASLIGTPSSTTLGLKRATRRTSFMAARPVPPRQCWVGGRANTIDPHDCCCS